MAYHMTCQIMTTLCHRGEGMLWILLCMSYQTFLALCVSVHDTQPYIMLIIIYIICISNVL